MIDDRTIGRALRSTQRVFAAAALCAGMQSAMAVVDNVGVLSPNPVSRTVEHGPGIFLDTINFQADAAHPLLFVRSTSSGIQSFRTTVFENQNDTEVLPDDDGRIDGYALIPGPPGYHIHPQGLVSGASGSYTVELSASAATITISAPVPGVTDESGAQVEISLTLNAAPDAVLSIPVAVDALAEARVEPALVEFQPGELGPKTVTVTGLADGVPDGNRAYRVQFGPVQSTDTRYAGLDPADVDLANIDLDGEITLPALSGRVSESGTAANFSVRLSAASDASVTIPVASSNTAEAKVEPTVLEFAAGSTTAQTVRVFGVDDAIADGEQAFDILLGPSQSADPKFAGITAQLQGRNLDDDASAEIVLGSASGLVTDENGKTARFTVQLASLPTAEVRIGLSVSHPGEARIEPAELVFSRTDATTPQSVTLTGLADGVEDEDIPYFVLFAPARSDDPAYAGLRPGVTPSALNQNTDRIIPQPENSYGGCALASSPQPAVKHLEWPLLLVLALGLHLRRRIDAIPEETFPASKEQRMRQFDACDKLTRGNMPHSKKYRLAQ